MSVKGSGRLGLPFPFLIRKVGLLPTAQLSLLEANLSTPHMNDIVYAHGDWDVLVYLKFHYALIEKKNWQFIS
jgi:hypothetical protein